MSDVDKYTETPKNPNGPLIRLACITLEVVRGVASTPEYAVALKAMRATKDDLISMQASRLQSR